MKNKIQQSKIYLDLIEYLPDISHKISGKKKLNLTKKEEFINNTFRCISEIEDKKNDLDFSVLFISVFPNYKLWREKISRKEYIEYHLEYYYISIVAIFDRLLHLVNFSYNLGISDRFIKLDNIITNSNVDKKLSKLLKQINKELQDIRSLQNKIKHKKKIRINQISHAALIEFSLKDKSIIKDFSKKTLNNLRSDMNWSYKEFVEDKKKELNENNKNIDKIIKNVLDELFNQYEKRKLEF